MLRRLLITGLVAVATVASLWWVGPLSSGAVNLLKPVSAEAQHREFPDSYEPRHKGHVDLGTGLYIRNDEDLIVRGVPAIVFQRTYRSRDRKVRELGIGTT